VTTPVLIRRDEDGLAIVVEPCLDGRAGRCRRHGRREPLAALPEPFSDEAHKVAHRVQHSAGVPGFLVLAALARAWRAEHLRAA
jgi:hypothetical protein